ncbi:MAG: hypothetical protein ABIO02_02200, partial [Patescibacteria group bacterium]
MKDFKEYARNTTQCFFEGIVNFFIFLPYFFSVTTLAKTLFHPWKNITEQKASKGFSFSEWGNRLSYNLVSRGMGFTMRSSILIFYVLAQIFYFVSLLVIVPLYFLVLPFLFLINKTEP